MQRRQRRDLGPASGARAQSAIRRQLYRLGLGLAFLLAWCQPSSVHAEPRIFNILDFQFEDGSVLPELRIAFDTQGTLSAAHDNAILLMPGANANRHAYDAVIGPGKTFDTDKYFVITADLIGSGESAVPADGMGQDFPRYTIRDMMEAEAALVSRGLELPGVRMVVGAGLGSDVALEFAVHHPEAVRGLVLLAPSPKTDPGSRLILDLLNSIVALDPEWQGGRYAHNPIEGLRHAGMLYYPWTVSAGYLDRTSPNRVAKELEQTARSFGEWDANALVLRYGAYRAHDIGVPFRGDVAAALARIEAPVLLLPCASDRLVGTAGAQRIRNDVKQAVYAEIPGDLGHRAIRALPETAEWDFIDRQIRKFMASLK
jgi:homoserine O-acetyltransferase